MIRSLPLPVLTIQSGVEPPLSKISSHLLLLVVIICSVTCVAQQRESDLLPNVFKSDKGEALPYRLFVPPHYDSQRKYPVIVYLHGGGGVGNDNHKQIQGS